MNRIMALFAGYRQNKRDKQIYFNMKLDPLANPLTVKLHLN